VGEPVVREFFGSLVNSGAEIGYLITTGYFTPQAVTFAEGKPIILMDIDRLLEWMKSIK
jgi:restriction system protein